ncbi:hypothetical protein ACT2CV_05440 [Pasteurellaceae bacterium 22721_9_1]
MKKLIKLGVIGLSVILSGCTMLLWDYDPVTEETVKREDFAKDNVRAFGQTKTNQQLVMMGDTYWYFINPEESAELFKVLNTKLPKAFSTAQNQPFNVVLSENAKSFYSNFTLYYEPQNSKEKAILENLGFNPTKQNPKLYNKGYRLTGEMYLKANDVARNYQFETPLPIHIKTEKTSTKITDPVGFVAKVVATPAMLVGDVALVGLAILLSPIAAISN